MKIEIGVNGRGIVITTVRKEEEKLSKAFKDGFAMAKSLYRENDWEERYAKK